MPGEGRWEYPGEEDRAQGGGRLQYMKGPLGQGFLLLRGDGLAQGRTGRWAGAQPKLSSPAHSTSPVGLSEDHPPPAAPTGDGLDEEKDEAAARPKLSMPEGLDSREAMVSGPGVAPSFPGPPSCFPLWSPRTLGHPPYLLVCLPQLLLTPDTPGSQLSAVAPSLKPRLVPAGGGRQRRSSRHPPALCSSGAAPPPPMKAHLHVLPAGGIF